MAKTDRTVVIAVNRYIKTKRNTNALWHSILLLFSKYAGLEVLRLCPY